MIIYAPIPCIQITVIRSYLGLSLKTIPTLQLATAAALLLAPTLEAGYTSFVDPELFASWIPSPIKGPGWTYKAPHSLAFRYILDCHLQPVAPQPIGPSREAIKLDVASLLFLQAPKEQISPIVFL